MRPAERGHALFAMLAQFALRLICGMSLTWAVMPRRQVTSGFFRIQMLVVLGLSVLAALTYEPPRDGVIALRPSAAVGACIGLAAAAFLGSIVWTLDRRTAGVMLIVLIAAVSVVLLTASVDVAELRGFRRALGVVSEFSSASMVGISVTGMLLGHWYLTAPTMSIAPLGRVNLYFGVAGVVRLVLSAIGLWLAWETLASGSPWLWLGTRWAAGIGGPLAASLAVWRILKYRNTQSATGVLFVGVILTFLGETLATLLYREFSTPL